MNTSAIVVFNSTASFVKFNKGVKLDIKYWKPIQIFVLIEAGSSLTSSSVFSDITFQTDFFNYEYFLVEDADYIELMTLVRFTPEYCWQWQFIYVNRFSKSTTKWLGKKFKINKHDNFHGCSTEFLFRVGDPSYFLFDEAQTPENVNCKGYLCRSIQALSESINLKYRSNVLVKNN